MSNRLLKSRRAAPAEPARTALFYRQLAETLPHMAWSVRPDGTTDFLNARVYEYTGRSHRQMVNLGWRSVVHPDDWEDYIAQRAKAFRKGQPYELEYRLRRRDGKYLWHLGAAVPLREGGRIVRWFGTSTDIEKQKRAERLLGKAREALSSLLGARADGPDALSSRFRRLLENAPVMVWESGPDKLCTYFNKPWLDFTGRSMEQEVGAGWAEGVHPDDLQRCLATYEGAFDARTPFEMEYRLRRGDGQYRWIFDRGVPMIDPARGFLGYIGSCIDISERRAAELQQGEQQERFRSFLDSMPAVAWIKDSRLRYVWVSASYTRTHGKTLLDVQGREDVDIWPAHLARQFRSDDEKALRANGPVQSIDSAPYADGAAARWMVVKFPMTDSEGALGVAGIGFDLTARAREEVGAGGEEALFPLERLSSRERQVLRLIVDGRTSAEVAKSLGLSPKSVDTYRSRLMAKLSIEDLPALVKFAIRYGLTTET